MEEFHQPGDTAEFSTVGLLYPQVRIPFVRSTFLLIAVLFFLNQTPNVQAQTGSWVRQRTGTFAWLHSIFFLNEQRGWVAGSKGALLATIDGGKTWQLQPRPSNDVLRDVYFIDESNGWLLCERNEYELKAKDDSRAYLLQTTDGGSHWNRVNLGKNIDVRLLRAVFSTAGRGWAFGESGSIFFTRDAGSNWIRLPSPTQHLLLGGTFIDNDRGWIVGAGATILQTSDGGQTWHLSQLPGADGVRFTAASFVDNRRGWAVGAAGVVYRTENGGRTWQQQSSGVTADLLDVKFLDAQEGWAVGTEGTIVHTNDGGTNWVVEQTGIEHPIERVAFSDRTHGWAVGFGGTLVAYVERQAPVRR